MKCTCCGAEIAAGQATCPVCGFPTLVVGNVDTDELIKNHREKKLGDVSVYLRTFAYSVGDERVSLDRTDYIKLADAKELQTDQILWLDSAFEPMASIRTVSLEIEIRKGSESKKAVLKAAPTEAISHASIGIVLKEGFKIQLAVGVREKYILSEPASLL